MAITQFDYTPSYNIGETEEERKRREEEERLRAQGMAPAPATATEPVAPTSAASFGDVVGQYAANRLGQAQTRLGEVANAFTDPAAAFAARMGMTPEAAANTEVSSTQVKTYGDGSQEEIVKRQIPAAQAQPVSPEVMAAPAPMAAPQPQAQPAAQPQAAPGQRPLPRNVTMGPDGKLSIGGFGSTPAAAPAPEVAAPAPVVEPPSAQPAMAAPQPAPQPVAPQPLAAPAPAMAPPAAMAQPMPAPVSPAEMGAPPAPGPGVQVAGPAQMPPAPAPAPAAAPAPAPAAAPAVAAPVDFTSQLKEIYQDPDRLAAFIGNTANDKAARKVAKDLYIAHETGTYKQDQALRTLEAAAVGDPKAANQVMRDLRKEEGSYIKAILFSRLGLSKLAEEEQLKLGGGRQIGQRQVGGEFYTVETDARGAVVRAWDAEGRSQGDRALSKINAEGVKQTAQAATATRIRDAAGVEWSQVPTPQGMRFYNNKGELGVPEGRTVPIAVGSDVELRNQMQIQDLTNKLMFAGPTASAAEREKIIAESEARYGLLPEAYKAQVRAAAPQPPAAMTAPAMAAPGAPAAAAPAPQAGPVAPSQVPAAPSRAPAAAPAPTGAPAIGAPSAAGGTPAQRESASAANRAAIEADIQRRKELAIAEQKPEAAARGADAATTVKNQKFADRTYDLMKPINEAILKSTGSSIGAGVDTVAAALGKSTQGSQAIARLNVLSYGILSNIPRFEGPQSDIDVQMYKQAAGDFANRKLPVEDRLAALDALRTILQRYDTAGKNDWTFGGTNTPASAGGSIRIIKREKVQ